MRARSAGVPRPILTPLQMRERTARRTLAALGYNECVTYSFIDADGGACSAAGPRPSRLENPISSEMTHLRPDLLPGLLQAAARNQARGFMDLALFEIGPAFHGGEPEEQHLQAAGLLVGAVAPRDPYGSRRTVDRLRRQGRCRGGAGRPWRARHACRSRGARRLVASRAVRRHRPWAEGAWPPSARCTRRS